MFSVYSGYKVENLVNSQIENFIKWYKRYGLSIHYYQVDKNATEVNTDSFYNDKVVPQIKFKQPVSIHGRIDSNEFTLETQLFGFHLERLFKVIVLDAYLIKQDIILTVGDVLRILAMKEFSKNITYDVGNIKGDITYEVSEIQPHNYIMVPNTVFEWSLLLKRVDTYDFNY